MFKTKKSKPTEPKVLNDIPDGTAIKVGTDNYFFIKGRRRYKIQSPAILLSQNYPRVLWVTAETAKRIPLATSKIGFREGTVVKDFSNGKMYLISNNKARHIISPIAFEQLDNPNAILVSPKDIELHERGEDLARL